MFVAPMGNRQAGYSPAVMITNLQKRVDEKMTPEEIAKKEVDELVENIDRSFDELKVLSDLDLKTSFKDSFIHQGKTPEVAEKMAEIAAQGR